MVLVFFRSNSVSLIYANLSVVSSLWLCCSAYVCEPYNGTVCKDALGSSLVFFDLSKTDFESSEVLMLGFKAVFDNSHDSENCGMFAFPLVCHYVFPPCRVDVAVPTPRPICKEDCLTSSLELCPAVWNAIITVIENVQTQHLGVPSCGPLPYMNGGDETECIGVSDLSPPGDRMNTIQTGETG